MTEIASSPLNHPGRSQLFQPRSVWLVSTAMVLIVACTTTLGIRGWTRQRLEKTIAVVNRPIGVEFDKTERPYAPFFQAAAIVIGVVSVALGIWAAIHAVNYRHKLRKRFLIYGFLFTAAAYPLSFGPAYWLAGPPGICWRIRHVVFRPIVWMACRSSRVATVASWYAELGETDGCDVSFENDEMRLWFPGFSVTYRTMTSCFISLEPDADDPAPDADLMEAEEADTGIGDEETGTAREDDEAEPNRTGGPGTPSV